jgi:hypothetical protein
MAILYVCCHFGTFFPIFCTKKIWKNFQPIKYFVVVPLLQVSRMVAELCHKALANSLTRKNYETDSNQRLLDKHVSGIKSFYFYSLVNCKFVNQLQGEKIGRIFEVWANF